MLKKLLSGLLALTMIGAMTVTSFAAPVSLASRLTDLAGPAIDEDGNQMSDTGTSISPGQTIYFLLPPQMASVLGNTTNFKLTSRKITNSKLVNKVALVEKRMPSGKNYDLPNRQIQSPTMTQLTNKVPSGNRNTYLAITLNHTTSAEEYKIDVDATFTARKAGTYNFRFGTGTTLDTANTPVNNPNVLSTDTFAVGDKVSFRASFYVANTESRGNSDVTVPVGNKVQSIKPVPNDTNVITFEAGSDAIASLTFVASSNPAKISAQLSNKWTTDLANMFSKAEAYIWRFTPTTIDATSRATLLLNNRFSEDSGVNPKKVYIYTVSADGKLTNVTSSFSYSADDDAYSTKVRAVGTYIISDIRIK